MQAVGIGDLHLTSSSGKGGLAAYIKDSDSMVARAALKVLREANHAGIRHVFFYGDLCEGTRMSYEAQLALLKILRTPGFDFHLILGNHDLFAEDPSLGHSLEIIQEFKLPNVHVYTEPTKVRIEDAKVNFLPWPYTDFDPKCLNVFHNGVKGAKHDSGKPITEGESGKAWAVGGHLHTNQRVRNTYFSGTLYQQRFGEGPEKFYHRIEFDDGTWSVSSVPVKTEYILHSVEVSTRKQLQSLPKGPKDLIRVILVDGFQANLEDMAGSNVVSVKVANSAHELALSKVADLQHGSEIEVSTDEFFDAWLSTQPVPDDLKVAATKIRSSTLKGLSK